VERGRVKDESVGVKDVEDGALSSATRARIEAFILIY
jgi:hypothetical protein